MKTPHSAYVVGLVLTCSALAQRQVAAPRGANSRIAYSADQFRGSDFNVIYVRSADEFWNRYDQNKPAILANLAHYARAGLNMVRVFGSVPSWLNYTYWGPYFDSNFTQSMGTYQGKVADLFARCDDVELGLNYVISNTFGGSPELFVGTSTSGPTGVIGAVVDTAGSGVILRILTSPGQYSDILVRTYPSLPFSDAMIYPGYHAWPILCSQYQDWRDNPGAQLGGFLKDFMLAHATAASQPALMAWQLGNEPKGLSPHYGDILQGIANHLGSTSVNPNAVPSNIGAVNDITFMPRGTTTWDDTAFGRAISPHLLASTANLRSKFPWWGFHSALDAITKWGASGGCNDSGVDRAWAQFTNLRDNAHIALASEHSAYTWDPRPVTTEEVSCRNVTGQMLTDLDLACVQPYAAVNGGLGYSAFSFMPSDVASVLGGGAGEAGVVMLPGGTIISPREHEAMRDNYRINSPALAFPTPSDPNGSNLDSGLSDYVVPVVARSKFDSTGNCRVLAVWADNYDPVPAHTRSTPPQTPFKSKRIFAEGGVQASGSSAVTWLPASSPAAVVVDISKGPMTAFDRQELLVFEKCDPSNATYPSGKSQHWCGSAHLQVEQNNSTTDPWLRGQILTRERMSHPEVVLKPKVVYLRETTDQAGNIIVPQQSEFLVAYTRPVAKSENPNEHYGAADDSAQRYFRVFGDPADTLNTNKFKYEVVYSVMRVASVAASAVLPTVLATVGDVQETGVANGCMNPSPAATPGASGMLLDLASDGTGNGKVLAVYLKKQDSFFDVSDSYASGTSPTRSWAAWQDESKWNIYPWELYARWYSVDAQGSGTWGNEVKISRSYPGGMAGFLHDTKLGAAMAFNPGGAPSSLDGHAPANGWEFVRRPRQAEYLPVVDATCNVVRDAQNAVRAEVLFKQLGNWMPDHWTHTVAPPPMGYELMRVSYDGSSWSAPMRAYCSLCVAPEDPPPYSYRSSEGDWVQGSPEVVMLTPGVPLVRSLWAFQLGNSLYVMDDYDHYLYQTPVTGSGVDSRFITTCKVATNGIDQKICAYQRLERDGSGGLRVRLHVWSNYGSGGSADVTVPLNSGGSEVHRDFESHIISVNLTGANAQAQSTEYEVVWVQNARIWNAAVTLFSNNTMTVGAPVELSANGQHTAPASGRTAKLKASTIPKGVLFSRDGLLMFRNY